MRTVYVHDADAAALRARIAALQAEAREAGLRGWALRGTPSRNAFLRALERDVADGRSSVAFIDLRAETGDLEQVGFRLVETIRRRPDLARFCRPIVCTDEMTGENAHYAGTVGAFAIVDTTWAHDAPGTPLVDVLHWAIAETAGELRFVRRAVLVVPEDGADVVDEQQEMAAHFEAWFGFMPTDLHLALLWGMANAVELEFLKRYLTSIGVAVSERSAKRHLEKLQQGMGPHLAAMGRPETGRAEIARRFLAEIVPPHPDPFSELNWPMLTHVRELWDHAPRIVRLAYLEPSALDVLAAFFDALDVSQVGARARHDAISRATADAARRLELPHATAWSTAYRAVHAIDDAWTDDRLHGDTFPLIEHELGTPL